MVEFSPNILEDRKENYNVIVDSFTVDVQILNPIGLVHFQRRYPIFRNPRILELVRLIEYSYKLTPGSNTEVNPELFDVINAKFISILKEKNVLYRIKWANIPEEWNGKYFVLRNYTQTTEITESDLADLSNNQKIMVTINSKKDYFISSEDKTKLIFWDMEIPFDLSDQDEIIQVPAGIGGGGTAPPTLPPVLPFETDGTPIFDQDLGVIHYDTPQTVQEPQIIPENEETNNNGGTDPFGNA